jgi:hypothetical protein
MASKTLLEWLWVLGSALLALGRVLWTCWNACGGCYGWCHGNTFTVVAVQQLHCRDERRQSDVN